MSNEYEPAYGDYLEDSLMRKVKVPVAIASTALDIEDDLDELLQGELDDVQDRQCEPSSPRAERIEQADAIQVEGSRKVSSGAVGELQYEGYCFPWESVELLLPELLGETNEDLLARLSALSTATIDYLAIRSLYCAINIVLNRRGRVAPRFRFGRRPPALVRSNSDMTLGRDRQVIDLDWLARGGWTGNVGRRESYRCMFSPAGLDRAAANEFVVHPAPAKEKLDWLRLPRELELLLDSIQTKAWADKFRDVTRGPHRATSGTLSYGRVENLLLYQCGRHPQKRVAAKRLAKAWACDRLAGGDLALAASLLTHWEGSARKFTTKKFEALLAEANKRLSELE